MAETIINPVIKLGSSGDSVKIWQIYLQGEKLLNPPASGMFDEATEKATKQFQAKHGLSADGIVGRITWGFIASLKHPAPNIIKSTKDLLSWIHNNLGGIVKQAIEGKIYTEDWLGSIAARETGFIITKYANRGMNVNEISALTKGDFRGGIYHGYGFWQVDIGSYPDFISSGSWKDPMICAKKAVAILEEKRIYLTKYNLSGEELERAITAAYNTGQGNVAKSIQEKRDVDSTTTDNNYSADVFEKRKVYRGLADASSVTNGR